MRTQRWQTGVLSLVFALSISLSLAGCGGGDGPSVPKGAGADAAAKAKLEEEGPLRKGQKAKMRPMNQLQTAD